MEIVNAEVQFKKKKQSVMVVSFNIMPNLVILNKALQEQDNGVIPADKDQLVNEIPCKAVLQQHPVQEVNNQEVGLVP